MKRRKISALLITVITITTGLMAGCRGAVEQPTPSATPAETAANITLAATELPAITQPPSLTPAATPQAIATATPTPEPTATLQPSDAPSPTEKPKATAKPAVTPKPAATPKPATTPKQEAAPQPEPTQPHEPEATPTPTPTEAAELPPAQDTVSTNEPEPTPEPAPVDEVIWLDATGLLTGVNTVRRDNGVPELSLGGKDLKEMCERMAREGSPNCYNGRQSAARGNGKQSTIGNLLASVHTPHIGNDPAYTSLSVAACEYKGVKYYLIEAN